MLSNKMLEELNRQMVAELYSGYLYLAMSAHLDAKNLRGLARWMRAQAAEEGTHGMKFYGFINARGGKAKMSAVEAPPAEWANPLALFEHVLAHEQKVSGLINNLVNLAQQEKDHATAEFLQWFVKEQVEEEAAATEIVQDLRTIGDSGSGLLMLDQALGHRKDPTGGAGE